MLPLRTSKSIRTHRNIRTMRSLHTRVGPARGEWSRIREGEQIARSLRRLQGARVA